MCYQPPISSSESIYDVDIDPDPHTGKKRSEGGEGASESKDQNESNFLDAH